MAEEPTPLNYRSPADEPRRPSALRVMAGLFFGLLFISSTGIGLSILVAICLDHTAAQGMPLWAAILLYCFIPIVLFASGVVLFRLTIRQFKRQSKQPSRTDPPKIAST